MDIMLGSRSLEILNPIRLQTEDPVLEFSPMLKKKKSTQVVSQHSKQKRKKKGGGLFLLCWLSTGREVFFLCDGVIGTRIDHL